MFYLFTLCIFLYWFFRIIFFKKTTFVSTSWIVVNVLREAWQDLRPKQCESSNEEARVALGSEKNLHISRGLMQHVSNNTSAERMHPLNQSLIFAPFLLNLLLNAASVNVFRNVVQLKFAAISRNIRTVLQYLFLVIIYGIYFILLGPSIFIFNAIFMIRVQSSLHPVKTVIFGSDTIIFCTFSTLYYIAPSICPNRRLYFVNFKWQIKWQTGWRWHENHTKA